MQIKLAVIHGDGIGVDIIDCAIQVLNKMGELYNHKFLYEMVTVGGVAIDKYGVPLPKDQLKKCLDSDSVLLGAVGGPKWDTLPGDLRPERALLGLRKELGLFANVRPARLMPVLKDASPLKDQIVDRGIDMIILRELTGGLYFGNSGRKTLLDGTVSAYDTEMYNQREIERIVRMAFDIAMSRKKEVISIDKANVLESSRLWREVVDSIKTEYPEVTVKNMLVDNAAMQLVRNPAQFDVVVTSNIFGDILSDEAAQITGSIGLLPSASLGEGGRGMYEPIHGSAPDLAGKNVANPIAMILSLAMMFRYSFKLDEEAQVIERAVSEVLEKGYRTLDILDNDTQPLGTKEITEKIISYL